MTGEAGQQMGKDDAQVSRAGSPRRQRVVFLPQGKQATAHHPRQPDPVQQRQNQRDGEIHVKRRPFLGHDCRQGHPQRQLRNGPQELDHALDDVVDHAAEVAGHAAQQRSQEEGQGHADQADGQRNARAVHRARKDVPRQRIQAEDPDADAGPVAGLPQTEESVPHFHQSRQAIGLRFDEELQRQNDVPGLHETQAQGDGVALLLQPVDVGAAQSVLVGPVDGARRRLLITPEALRRLVGRDEFRQGGDEIQQQ